MKRAVLLSAIAAVLLVLVFCAGAVPNEPDATSPEIQALKKEIASLRERVESLEKRLNERRTIVVPSPDGQRRQIMPPGRPPSRPAPRGWQKRWFNGVPYYVIPIEQKTEPRTRRSP
jgi:hypothetical protein